MGKHTVSFRSNPINAFAISAGYESWELVPDATVIVPARRVTHPVYTDAFRLQATGFGGRTDVYEPQSDHAFEDGRTLTLSGEYKYIQSSTTLHSINQSI